MSPEVEQAAFQIIASVGAARSSYIEAIHKAHDGDFDGAEALIKEGQELFNVGHNAHFGLVQNEAAGNESEFALILMHAEDQLMSAEGFGILAEEFVSVYKRINA